MSRPRLLPLLMLSGGLLAGCKLLALGQAVEWPAGLPGIPSMGRLDGMLIASATASAPPAPVSPDPVSPNPVQHGAAPAAAKPSTAPAMPVPEPDPVSIAERAVLESLRERRGQLERREQALAAREAVLAAAESRLKSRLDEMAALQARLEKLEQSRNEREEAGWRGLVKTYETMRPRDAAAVFDELDMPVLVRIVDRMREAKAAPVLGAMRPDRARLLTAELARHRSRANDPDGPDNSQDARR
ncbi:Hypothetical protein HVIM_02148 [Roseomonas mucosa]|uniref:Uncharacterized conserved protein n=1 Tax=Roseomonas mucosa TaxID=207340 RepID=A0A1S8D6J8_9PROT|nr:MULTISPECIES: hypothetical protein [Roseomonas]MBS5902369.1 hypothetical protein [Acetobacteraceae bacterium]MCG7350891.1 hypothetical protein [Roseomonas mucosa]MCG7356365.1 hypothetical protein [Roseomonas mucosa]MDT8289158.1 hypothetical protein [Roseomonas mucosa]MDT8293148.1 hypothetical protein [Roseomonas mucosa]